MQFLCFGDSLTNGYDVPRGLGWVELIQKEFPRIDVQNHGVDGDTLQGILYRVERVSDSRRYIFLMGGSNDILMGRDERYCFRKMTELIACVRAKGGVPIVGLPPQLDFDINGLDRVLVRYIDLLKQYCEDEHIDIIDFYRVIHEAGQRGELLFAGDVHPNEKGYALMAEEGKQVLTRLL